LAPRIPGVLLVCIAGIAGSFLFGFATFGGAVVGTIPSGLPPLAMPPALDIDQHRALLLASLIIALISFTEAMSSCRILARVRGDRWDENQELVGQGLSKIASGFSGAYPVSGSFSRSALNLYVGAVSGWSSLVVAVCVLATLLWATEYLYHLPRAVLAAIIVIAVVGLIDLRRFRELWRTSRTDAAVAALTFVATLASVPELYWGVLAGLVLSVLCNLYRRARPRVV